MDLLRDAILVLDSTLRLSTPLIFCALAGMISERAGVIDISLEGKLLGSAFAAAAVAALTGSAWIGLMAAVGASIFLSLIHGFATITHRGQQIVSGIAINMLVSGLTIVAGIALFQRGGNTPFLEGAARFNPIALPGADTLADIPVLGLVWSELISGHTLQVYLALLATPFIAWMLARTRFGLRLRAVGEAPDAVDSAGLSVALLRYQAVMIAGVLCGLAGAYLSIGHGSSFVREMSAGKGYIALAAMVLGRWRAWPALIACLLFGFLEALAARLQGVELPIVGEIASDFLLVLPYVATVILLAGFFGKAIAPRALGKAYTKER